MGRYSTASSAVFLSEADSREAEIAAPERTTIEDGIKALLKSLEHDKKPSTIQFYGQRLNVLRSNCSATGVHFVDQLGPDLIRQFRCERLDSGVSTGTVRHDEVAAKRLTQFCFDEDKIKKDPLAKFKPLPLRQKEVPTAEQWEIEKILKVIETAQFDAKAGERKYARRRDRMIFLTIVDTGCRPGEVLSLRKGDLRPDNGVLHIQRSGMSDTRKNGVSYYAPVSAYWWAELDAYLRKRPKLADNDLLFPLLTDGQMSSRQWSQRFKKYCQSAGVDGITSRSIRHTVSGETAKKRGTFAAQRMLGQRSLQSPERYARHAGWEPEYAKETHNDTSLLDAIARESGRLKEKMKPVFLKK